MLRWLGLVLVIGLASAPAADAQVFKPKAKKPAAEKTDKPDKPDKSDKADKSDAPKKSSATAEKKSAKKQPRTADSKKRTTKAKKKGAAEAAPKDTDKDFVEITDDDDIE